MPARVRFVAWTGWGKIPVMGFALRTTRTILIDGGSGPKAIVKAMQQVADALDAGEVVVLFPEAKLSRTGGMRPFQRGLERMLKQTERPVPVVPVCLRNVWGSIFSYAGGRILWKWPRPWAKRASVTFGAPLPPTTPAADVRAAIQEWSADTAIREAKSVRPVHRTFVRVASGWRQMFRPCWVDTAGAAPRP